MLTSNQTPSSNPVASNAPLSAIGQSGASNTMPGTGSGRSASNSSGFMNKMKIQYVLGGLLVALIAIGSGVGFWLSQTSQDVRQQAAVDNEYGTTCVGSTPVKCSCNVCGSSQADCNNKCGSGPSNGSPLPVAGCTSVGQCLGNNTCTPTDVATGASSGSGASCGGSNNNGTCGANGQPACNGVSCDSGLVLQGSTCVFPTAANCSAAAARGLGCACGSGGQCASAFCQGGVCVPQQSGGTSPLGSSCTSNANCASGFCDNGTCAVPGTGGGSSPSPISSFGCTSVGQCVNFGTCTPSDVSTNASAGTGASCGGSNNNSTCGAVGQQACNGVSCDSGLVLQGSTCVLAGATGCSAASNRGNGCACTVGIQCDSDVCQAGVCVPQQTGGTAPLGTACTSGTTCASGYCSPATNQCAVAPNNACSVTNVTGICTAAGHVCQNGVCAPTSSTAQCTGATPVTCACNKCAANSAACTDVCNPSSSNAACSATNTTGNCPAGQICNAGTCQNNVDRGLCTTNSQCPSNNCVNGQCTFCGHDGAQTCVNGDVCDSGLTRDQFGICRAPAKCTSVGQCASGGTCSASDVAMNAVAGSGASCGENLVTLEGSGYTCSKARPNGTCPYNRYCDAGQCKPTLSFFDLTCGGEGQPLCCSNQDLSIGQKCTNTDGSSTGWQACDVGYFIDLKSNPKVCRKPLSNSEIIATAGHNYCVQAGQCVGYNTCSATDVANQTGPTTGDSCIPSLSGTLGACAAGTTCGPGGKLYVCRDGQFTWTEDDGYCGGAAGTDDCGPGSDQWCSNGKEVGDTCNVFNGVGGICNASDINPNPYITVYGACTCSGQAIVPCCVGGQTMNVSVPQCVQMSGTLGVCGLASAEPTTCPAGYMKTTNGSCTYAPASTGTGGPTAVDACQNGTCSSPAGGCIAIHYCSQLWPDGTCVNDVPQVTQGSVNAQQVANQTCMCVQVDVLNGEHNSCVNGHINGDYSTLLGASIVCPNVACSTPSPTPPVVQPGTTPSPIAQVTPTPSVPPTSPPPGPICVGITRNGAVSVGNPVTFTCAPVAGITNYQARIRVNDGAFTNLTMNGSTTAPYTIPSAGLYTVQCRICTGTADSTCQAWEPV